MTACYSDVMLKPEKANRGFADWPDRLWATIRSAFEGKTMCHTQSAQRDLERHVDPEAQRLALFALFRGYMSL